MLTSEEDAAEEIRFWIDFLDRGSPNIKGDGDTYEKKPLSWFSGAVPVGLSQKLDIINDMTEEWFVFGDVNPGDLDGRLDIATAGKGHDHGGQVALARHRFVSPREIRGKTKIASPVMVESALATLERDGEYGCITVISANIGGKWVNANATAPRIHTTGRQEWVYSKTRKEFDHGRIQVAMGLAFSQRYEWVVEIGPPGGFALSLSTDPTGIQDLFRRREAPEGMSRRAALKHWVRQHMRRRRNDPAALAAVRAHLRGRAEFEWFGLHGIIYPSAYDLERTAA